MLTSGHKTVDLTSTKDFRMPLGIVLDFTVALLFKVFFLCVQDHSVIADLSVAAYHLHVHLQSKLRHRPLLSTGGLQLNYI